MSWSRVTAFMLLAACNGASGPCVDRDSAATALRGEWTISFDVDSSIAWHDRASRPVNGSMTLLANRTVRVAYPRIGVPSSYGVYDIDFAAWGFRPAGDRLPAVVAGGLAGDSVLIRFDTDRLGFNMTL